MAARVNDLGVHPRKFLRPARSSGAVIVCRSIFVRHHQGDGGLRVVNVQCAASGNQFDKRRCAVVVADIKRNGDAVATWAAAKDSETEHPDNIPKASGFVLSGHAFRHGHVSIENRAREKHRKFDSGFLRGLGDFNLHAVGDGLRSGVAVNDFAKGDWFLFVFMMSVIQAFKFSGFAFGAGFGCACQSANVRNTLASGAR